MCYFGVQASHKYHVKFHLNPFIYIQSFSVKVEQTTRENAALNPATQHAMPPEFGRKWQTECLNTRFPLPTLLCAGYSMKLIYLFI